MTYAMQMRSLIEYNRWANERVLDAADGVSDEEFARKAAAAPSNMGSRRSPRWIR